MPQGYLCFVLHAHLPYVHHPEYEEFLEERWLFEAITETYIPLLLMFARLEEEGIPFTLTLSLSPTLLNMLVDPHLQSRYERHLEKLIELAHKEIQRTWGSVFEPLARMYLEHFQNCQRVWKNYGGNLLPYFLHFAQKGYLELITTAATHPFLPAYRSFPRVVEAQIRLGLDYFEHLFGFRPRGMWLPECGYYPGLDEILERVGVEYFFVERHGLEYAEPRPIFGVYAPIFTSSQVAVFARDPLTSEQVWSSEMGYPGDPNYREFYRDIGYELDYHYIRPYINPDGVRTNTGIKYYRVTGKTDWKDIYNPFAARLVAQAHAEDFLSKNIARLQELEGRMPFPPIIVAPYDAELFGHWWFEGPLWLEEVFRKLSEVYPTLQPITPTRYLERHPHQMEAQPATSSWGKKGYGEVWLGKENQEFYPHLLAITEKMLYLVDSYSHPSPALQRALTQATRELLLSQSSDWPFLRHTGSAFEYATKRLTLHISRFLKLFSDIQKDTVDLPWLEAMEYLDDLFPHLSWEYLQEVFSSPLMLRKVKR